MCQYEAPAWGPSHWAKILSVKLHAALPVHLGQRVSFGRGAWEGDGVVGMVTCEVSGASRRGG